MLRVLAQMILSSRLLQSAEIIIKAIQIDNAFTGCDAEASLAAAVFRDIQRRPPGMFNTIQDDDG
jgi:hypothetical protein